MQTQKECEIRIAEFKKQLEDTKAKIFEAMKRQDAIQAEVAGAENDAATAKGDRQAALARGEDTAQPSKKLKDCQSKCELLQDEQAGLQNLLVELRGKESLLENKIKEGRLKILQGQSLELARIYNTQAEALAKVVEALNAVSLKIQESTGGGTAGFVVFYPESGALDNIPRIFFDESGLNLEQFVAKYPGRYPTNYNLPILERAFYDFTEHKRLLREGGAL